MNTTQLLRLPCTHLSEPLEHAEGGTPSEAERKNRSNRERKTGRKSIGETSGALNDCAHRMNLELMCLCVFVCSCKCVHLHVCLSVSVRLAGLSFQMQL